MNLMIIGGPQNPPMHGQQCHLARAHLLEAREHTLHHAILRFVSQPLEDDERGPTRYSIGNGFVFSAKKLGGA